MSKQTKEIQKLSEEDLKQKLIELKTQLVEQKRSRAAGELENLQAVKKTRRAIATILTLLGQQPSKPAKKEEA